MASQEDVVKALKSVGFEVLEYRDMALDEQHNGDPWWLPLWPSWNPFSFRFQFNFIGLFLTRNFLWFIEFFGLAPKGSYKVKSNTTYSSLLDLLNLLLFDTRFKKCFNREGGAVLTEARLALLHLCFLW